MKRSIGMVLLIFVILLSWLGSADSSSDVSPTVAIPANGGDSASCLVDPSAVADLQKERDAIQEKEKTLAAKEAELKAREQALSDEMKKLDETRAQIAASETQKKLELGEKVAKIVETLQTMSPKAASQLLATLDENLAVAAMNQMDTAKLAKMLNLMEPAKSSRLTELLAGVARSKDRVVATISDVNSTRKGGEKNDSNNKHDTSGTVQQQSAPTAQ